MLVVPLVSACAALPVPITARAAFVIQAFPIVASTAAPWIGLTVGLTISAVATFIARSRISAARREVVQARDLAAHLEHERDMAQKALVKNLEQERELSKEKMQFESQLNEFERYASLAQLALGAAHEINNPLLGILSHLELDWKDASGERRTEIEQCIEGARRISSAVHGLMDYARPGPLTLSQVDLSQLVGNALHFVEHQPLFRGLELQNCVPHDLPVITADANQISQVLMNLLLNAAQATPGPRRKDAIR